MRLTRRALLASAAVLPAAAGIEHLAAAEPRGDAVVLYDPDLVQGRSLAALPGALAVTGDRIRFAREIIARRPSLVRGVTRQADTVLIGEVATEAGYVMLREQVDGVAIDWTLVPRR